VPAGLRGRTGPRQPAVPGAARQGAKQPHTPESDPFAVGDPGTGTVTAPK
jgi:hypothetical protein